ncbi:MAG: CmcI family methyltransferase [Rhizobiaceae bacterium]
MEKLYQPNGRSFKSSFPATLLENLQKGTLAYTFRGVPCLKNPVDIAIYLRLIWDLKPGAIVELGSKAGGSALLFSGIVGMYGFPCHIYSIDLQPPENCKNPRITFLQGDVHNLDPVVADLLSDRQDAPLLVIEDSAHTLAGCSAALNTFAKIMRRGDVLVIEDGILDELDLPTDYLGGPNRAISEFFDSNPDVFEVMEQYCDMFGPNATYNPNGYLRKL